MIVIVLKLIVERKLIVVAPVVAGFLLRGILRWDLFVYLARCVLYLGTIRQLMPADTSSLSLTDTEHVN